MVQTDTVVSTRLPLQRSRVFSYHDELPACSARTARAAPPPSSMALAAYICFALALATLICVQGYRKRSLSASGAVLAFVVGLISFYPLSMFSVLGLSAQKPETPRSFASGHRHARQDSPLSNQRTSARTGAPPLDCRCASLAVK